MPSLRTKNPLVRQSDLHKHPRVKVCWLCKVPRHITEFFVDRNYRVSSTCSECVSDPSRYLYPVPAEMLVPPDSDHVPKGLLPVLSAWPAIPPGAQVGDAFQCVKLHCRQAYKACLARQERGCACPQGEEIAKRFQGA